MTACAVAGSRLTRVSFVNSAWSASVAQFKLAKTDYDLEYILHHVDREFVVREWCELTGQDLRTLVRVRRVPRRVDEEVSTVVSHLKSLFLSGKSVWEWLGSRLAVGVKVW